MFYVMPYELSALCKGLVVISCVKMSRSDCSRSLTAPFGGENTDAIDLSTQIKTEVRF